QTATEGVAQNFNLGFVNDANPTGGPWTVTTNWGDGVPLTGSVGASFVKADTTTQGSWIGTYGADGYYVSQDPNVRTPCYAQVSFSGQGDYTWTGSTSDPRALQKPENPSDHTASTWYTGGSGKYTIDVNLTDGAAHRIALYALDYDNGGRAETI